MIIQLLRLRAWTILQWFKARLWRVQRTNPSRSHIGCQYYGCINPVEVHFMGAVRFWSDAVREPATYHQTNWKFDPEEDESVVPTWALSPKRYTSDARAEAEEAAFDEIMDRLGLPYPEPVHVKMTDEEVDAALVKLSARVRAGLVK